MWAAESDPVGGIQHAQVPCSGPGMNTVEFSRADRTRRLLLDVRARRIARVLAAAVVTTWVVLTVAPVPSASADPCPDVEVLFARGTGEPPGVGGVGQAFVDSMRSQVGSRSLGVYAVNYEASADFASGMEFARTVVDGIRDAGAHVQSMAANCPKTRMVLGGYSQGAVVAGFGTPARVTGGGPCATR